MLHEVTSDCNKGFIWDRNGYYELDHITPSFVGVIFPLLSVCYSGIHKPIYRIAKGELTDQ